MRKNLTWHIMSWSVVFVIYLKYVCSSFEATAYIDAYNNRKNIRTTIINICHEHINNICITIIMFLCVPCRTSLFLLLRYICSIQIQYKFGLICRFAIAMRRCRNQWKLLSSLQPSTNRKEGNVRWRLDGVEEMRLKHPIFNSPRYTLTIRMKHDDNIRSLSLLCT